MSALDICLKKKLKCGAPAAKRSYPLLMLGCSEVCNYKKWWKMCHRTRSLKQTFLVLSGRVAASREQPQKMRNCCIFTQEFQICALQVFKNFHPTFPALVNVSVWLVPGCRC